MLDQEQAWLLAGAAAAVVALILFLLIIALFVKLGKMKKRYEALMNGERNANLEELLIGIQTRINGLDEKGADADRQIAAILKKMSGMQGKIGIYRYSAFGEVGNDLSFSIAMLNDKSDGVVLTGIYGRDQTYLYAKPLERGESTYTLSPEEKEVVSRTVKQG